MRYDSDRDNPYSLRSFDQVMRCNSCRLEAAAAVVVATAAVVEAVAVVVAFALIGEMRSSYSLLNSLV